MAQVPADKTCWSTTSAVHIEEVKAERTDKADRAGGWFPRRTGSTSRRLPTTAVELCTCPSPLERDRRRRYSPVSIRDKKAFIEAVYLELCPSLFITRNLPLHSSQTSLGGDTYRSIIVPPSCFI